MTQPGMFADGTPIPALGPGESDPQQTHDILVSREVGRIVARQEAQRVAEAMLVVGEHEPLDLAPYLAGTIKQPEPTRGHRIAHGGPQLLYPGLEHAIIGEMESGKSWFCAASVTAEVRNWRRVVYLHFEEVDPSGLIAQLRICGATNADIEEYLSFVGVEERRGIDELVRLRPSLVIIDGVNEAMSLYGQKVMEVDGAATFRRELVKPFTAVGAAVLCADHVTKDSETRGRYSLGSVHKGNALNGAMFMLENVEAFGRECRGMSRLYATKDRPGHLRKHGQPTKIPGKTWLGDLVIDMRLDAPPDQAGLTIYPARPMPDRAVVSVEERAEIARQELDGQVLAAVLDIIDHGEDAHVNRVVAVIKKRKSAVSDSLNRLAFSIPPKLIETKIGQTRYYTVEVPVPKIEDPTPP